MIISFAYSMPGNTCSKKVAPAPQPTEKHVTFKIKREAKRFKRFKRDEMEILRQQIQRREADLVRNFQERSRTKSLGDLRIVQ
jgi:hypothetical protein